MKKELVLICRWCYPETPEGLLKEGQDTTNKLCDFHIKDIRDKIEEWKQRKL